MIPSRDASDDKRGSSGNECPWRRVCKESDGACGNRKTAVGHMACCASQLCQGLCTLSEPDSFFALYPPKLDEEMFQGSGASVRCDGDCVNVIEPSAPPNDSPDDSGNDGHSGRDKGLNEPNPVGRGVLRELRPNELK